MPLFKAIYSFYDFSPQAKFHFAEPAAWVSSFGLSFFKPFMENSMD
jgi:hypothetical protein